VIVDRCGIPLAVTITRGNRHDVTQLPPLLDAIPPIPVHWVVERAFAWLHQFKRLRTRYRRRADLHQGLLDLACTIICLRRLRKSF